MQLRSVYAVITEQHAAIAMRLQSDCAVINAIAKRLCSDCNVIAKRLQSDCKAIDCD
jgi:hypothetical protein